MLAALSLPIFLTVTANQTTRSGKVSILEETSAQTKGHALPMPAAFTSSSYAPLLYARLRALSKRVS